MSAAIRLCEPWCADHYDAGGRDQWCHSVQQLIDLALVEPDADPTVRIGAESNPGLGATVSLTVVGASFVRHLAPHEARRIARHLLAAADLADGVAVTW